MHQTVNCAIETNEDAKVRDRLDRALDLIALVEGVGKFLPGVGTALFHPERNTPTLFVDLENHHLGLFAQSNNFGRVDVLVGPVHFGHVYQALDARFDLHKRTVIGDVGDLAEHAGALRVAPCNPGPGVVAQLLDAQRHTVLFLIEPKHFSGDFLTDCQHFGRVANATPRHVGDVQESVDSTQIDKCAVLGDVLDRACNDGALAQGFEELRALFALGQFNHGTPRNNHVVALAVELDDLELHGLALVGRGVLDRTRVDKRTRQEGADAIGHHGEAALDLAGHSAGDELPAVQRLLEGQPRREALRPITREAGFAAAIFKRFDGDRHEISCGDFELATVIVEFFNRNEALGLQSGIHDHEVVVNSNDLGRDDFARPHDMQIERFFKHLSKALDHGSGGLGFSGHG